MIENLTISISFSEVEETHIGSCFHLSEMSGESLIIQKPDNTFYFLCSNGCGIVGICQSFNWYIVSRDAFNGRLIIGIGLSGKEGINRELYRVQDETTLILWHDVLRFTFKSDFVCQFFPYNTHFKGKTRIDGALRFYIHDYYPTRYKGIPVFDRKMSSLVFRFKEDRQAAPAAKTFSLCIARTSFFREKAVSAVLVPIPAITREWNIVRFACSCSLLPHRLKVVGDFRATWIKEDHKQMEGTHGQDKLSDLIFHPDYSKDRDIFLMGDIISSGGDFA